MASKLVNTLLQVRSFRHNVLMNRKKQYSEKVQLEEAIKSLGNINVNNLEANIKLLLQDLHYLFTLTLIDVNSGRLNSLGLKYIESNKFLFPDLIYLFQYLNHPESSVQNYLKVELTPYLFWRFCHQTVALTSTHPRMDPADAQFISSYCKLVLFSTPELITCETFGELRTKLRSKIDKQTIKTYQDMFNVLFEEGALSALDFSYQSSPKLPEKVHEVICNATGTPSFKPCNSPLLYNLSLHQHASLINQNWLIPSTSENYADAAESAKARIISTSGTFGRFLNDMPTVGNVKFEIQVKMSGIRLVTVHYLRFTYNFIQDSQGKITFIMPIGHGTGCKLTFYKQRTIAKVVDIPNLEVANQVFKDREAIVTTTLYGKTKIAPVDNPLPQGSNPGEMLRYLIKTSLIEWFKMDQPSEKPPIELLTVVLDEAIRYGASPVYFYATVVEYLNKSWCQSGSFIDIYTHSVLTLYTLIQQGYGGSYEKSILDQSLVMIKGSSMNGASYLLKGQLSNPEYIEHQCITSLMMLLSLVQTSQEVDQYVNSVVESALDSVLNSVLSRLSFVQSDRPAVSLAISLASLAQYDTSSFETSVPDGLPMFAVKWESIFSATELMLCRINAFSSFFTEQTIPSIANKSLSLSKYFMSIVYQMATVFVKSEPPPPDVKINQYMSLYRQLWPLLHGYSEYAPIKIFLPMINNWLVTAGNALMQWGQDSLANDEFEPDSLDLSSSSLIDLFRFMADASAFLAGMQIANEPEAKAPLETYLSLSLATVRSYCSDLENILKAFFMKYVELPVTGTPKRELHRNQAFVVINNILALNYRWKEYSKEFTKKYDLDMSIYSNPMQGTISTIKTCIEHFNLSVADQISHACPLFQVKKIGLINKIVCNWNDDLRNQIYDDILIGIASVSNSIQQNLVPVHRKKCLSQMFIGLEKGILESMVYFCDYQNPQQFWDILDFMITIKQEAIDQTTITFQKQIAEGELNLDDIVKDATAFDYITSKKELKWDELVQLSNTADDNELVYLTMLMQQIVSHGFNDKKVLKAANERRKKSLIFSVQQQPSK